MAARKKAKRKTKARAKKKKVAKRRPRASRGASPRAASTPGDLTLSVARQMADVIERGLKRTLGKLPRRGTTAVAKQKLKEAVAMFRRQADAMREQAIDLEARGAEAAAAIWRPLRDRFDRAAADLRKRLGQ
ncbi:MAG TPA: hypothetical protein VFY93_01195 [Planctomycetota bacterium]|nr:hypothetical protein [Planctomycetota bacterium]